jgi:transcriptional regulator with XRE-family HTH domain
MTPKQFKTRRLKLKLSQAKLAKKLKLSVRTISRIECGVQAPSDYACNMMVSLSHLSPAPMGVM